MALGHKAGSYRKWLVWGAWSMLAACLLVLPPLVGAFIAGKPLAPYLNFSPSTLYVQHSPFSWPAFILLTLLILACIVPLLYRLYSVKVSSANPAPVCEPFPWWGWLGISLIVLNWTLVWTSVDEPNGWQR